MVLLNKIERTQYLSYMIKNASKNYIEQPAKGWIKDENQFMEINYFDGSPFPESISRNTVGRESDSEDDEDGYISSSDDESIEGDESDTEWEPK